jgi:hypothetical protein
VTDAALDQHRLAQSYADTAVATIRAHANPCFWLGENRERLGFIGTHAPGAVARIRDAVAARLKELGK